MVNEFFEIWHKFLSARNTYSETLNYTDSHSKLILVFFARINGLCEEIFLLINNDCFLSPQIIMRSTLESFVDLRCLILDKNYVDNVFAAEADADYKHLFHYSDENPYYKGTNKASSKKLKILKDDKSKNLNIIDRFKKSECEDLYRTVYNDLCRYAHGNVRALASKNFENNKVVVSPSFNSIDVLFVLSSTINIAISATHDVLKFYNKPKSELDEFTKMHDEVAALCNKFV